MHRNRTASAQLKLSCRFLYERNSEFALTRERTNYSFALQRELPLFPLGSF
jgi:hypothetical protein